MPHEAGLVFGHFVQHFQFFIKVLQLLLRLTGERQPFAVFIDIKYLLNGVAQCDAGFDQPPLDGPFSHT